MVLPVVGSAPGSTRGRVTGRLILTPLTLGLTDGDGDTTVVGRTVGSTHGASSVGTHGGGGVQGSSSVGTHGDWVAVGNTVGSTQGFASVGTHGGVQGLPWAGTHGGVHGLPWVGTQGVSDAVGETVGDGVGLQPVCAGFVFAIPLLPSHS